MESGNSGSLVFWWWCRRNSFSLAMDVVEEESIGGFCCFSAPPRKRQFDPMNWTTTQTCSSSSSSRRAPPVTQAFAEEAFSPSAPPLHEDDCVIGLNSRFPAASYSFSYVVFWASCPSGYYLLFLFRSLTPWELPGVIFQLSFCFVLWDFPTFILLFVHIHQGLKFGCWWRKCNSRSWRLDDDDLTLGKKVSGPASPCVSSSCRLLFTFSHSLHTHSIACSWIQARPSGNPISHHTTKAFLYSKLQQLTNPPLIDWLILSFFLLFPKNLL
jgi:hypothetical protein